MKNATKIIAYMFLLIFLPTFFGGVLYLLTAVVLEIFGVVSVEAAKYAMPPLLISAWSIVLAGLFGIISIFCES